MEIKINVEVDKVSLYKRHKSFLDILAIQGGFKKYRPKKKENKDFTAKVQELS